MFRSRRHWLRSAAILGLSGLGLPGLTLAAGRRCQHCGCSCSTRKICRLVCEEKKVTVTCWGAEDEDFCVPGPATRGCEHCDEVCAECDKDVASRPKKFVWSHWTPGCARVFTKTKLMKKTVTKKIPSYKWVVEDLCGECESKAESAKPGDGEKAPPPPKTDAQIKMPAK